MTLLLEEPSDTRQEPAVSTVEDRPSTKRRVLQATAAVTALVAVIVFAIAAPHLNEGTGDRTYRPTTFAEIDHHYEFGIGSLTVDLRDVDFPEGTHFISVDHGIGSARVLLPTDVAYDVTADLEAGEIDILGETEDGFSNEINAQSSTDTDDTTKATVIVDLDVDIGYGTVRQG